MRLACRLIVLACFAALVLPQAANAADRMWVGFQDDVSFRWSDDRTAALDRAEAAGATVIRTTIYWYRIAPTRPANAANPFDPAYKFDDLDEFVRGAQMRDIEVMLTIWGIPTWANGGRGPNFMPRRFADLTAFARAVATRYSGRFAEYPFVRFYTVGNESNLQQFLAPQFDGRGRSVGPRLYARMYRAAYAGIKAGSRRALVGIGETSPRGRDKPSPGAAQDSHSPGRFAQLVSQVRPKLKFDAWAHHPYPTSPNLRPTQRVRWPNVTLTQMERFEASLNRWFGREVSVWITEYGHETRPEERRGVTRARQSAYLRQAFNIARRDADVEMFIWFILRDDFTTKLSWQSGLYTRDWVPKPALARFGPAARPVDARNVIYRVRRGTRNPRLAFPAILLKVGSVPGATVGINYEIFDGRRLRGRAIASSLLGADGWLSFRPALAVARGHRYRLEVEATDVNGVTVTRTLQIVAT